MCGLVGADYDLRPYLSTLHKTGGPLNCKEFESYIPAFIDKKLDYKTMEEFRSHYESCPECREELSIQFLVTVGVWHLDNDDDSAFDFEDELRRRLDVNDRLIVRHRIFHDSQRYLITIGCILLGLLLIWHLG